MHASDAGRCSADAFNRGVLLQSRRAVSRKSGSIPVADPFLREHCYHGIPLLPAAAGIEALAEGAAFCRGEGHLTLRDVDIHNGLRFTDQRPLWIRVVAVRDAEGVECRLLSEFRNRDGKLVDPERVLIPGKARYDASASPVRFLTKSPEYGTRCSIRRMGR